MPFKKGQSGNPGGRKRENENVNRLARCYTKEAIERLVFWMRSDNPKASSSAAVAILDRGHGRPMQMAQVTGADGEPIKLILQSSDAAL